MDDPSRMSGESLETVIRVSDERWRAHRREHELEGEALSVAKALQAQALDIARTTVDKRLEGMNELRQQITSERGEFMTRTTFDARYETLVARISALERSKANLEGRIWAVGALVVIIELGLRFLKIG